jgi:hypothetical protein
MNQQVVIFLLYKRKSLPTTILFTLNLAGLLFEQPIPKPYPTPDQKKKKSVSLLFASDQYWSAQSQISVLSNY